VGDGHLGTLGIFVGLGLSCATAESLAYEYAREYTGSDEGSFLALTAVLIALVLVTAGKMLVEVLRQCEWDWYSASREKALAAELLESEREDEEKDEEMARKEISGVAYIVFLVGMAGGMIAMAKLPEKEGNFAFVSSVMGVVWMGITTHLRTQRKAGWWRWPLILAVALIVFLEYSRRQFEATGWWAGTGLLGGGFLGWLTVMLYWRGRRRLFGK